MGLRSIYASQLIRVSPSSTIRLLKRSAPQGTATIVPPVVISRESYFYLFDQFREIRPLLSIERNIRRLKLSITPVAPIGPGFDLIIREPITRKHFQMDMVMVSIRQKAMISVK